MELWDAYDRDGNLLGVDLVRGEPVPEGMYHIVSEVVVRHRDGRYLLMLRDPNKPICPGEWEIGAGGSALKGEDALACARRELLEETGIACDALEPVLEMVHEPDVLFYLFFAETETDPDAIVLQPGETVDYRWVDYGELKSLIDDGGVLRDSKARHIEIVQSGLGG